MIGLLIPGVSSVVKQQGSDALRFYMKELRSIPKMTREREKELVQRFQAGDRRAADELVCGSLRDVVYVARRYVASREPLEDLIAEGNLALLHALRKYDPSFGTRFATYARLWIRAYLTRYVRRGRSLVATPLHDQAALLAKVRAERRKLLSWGQNDAVDRVVAEKLGTTVEEIRAVEHRFSQRDISFDIPTYEEQPSLHETLPARVAAPDEIASMRELLSLLREAIKKTELSETERVILQRRLLCPPGDEPSLAQLGREMKISREWVRRLEQRSLERLDTTLESLR